MAITVQEIRETDVLKLKKQELHNYIKNLNTKKKSMKNASFSMNECNSLISLANTELKDRLSSRMTTVAIMLSTFSFIGSLIFNIISFFKC